MARSKYIYLIGLKDDVLAAFTVKREAYEWLARSRYQPSQVNFSRMVDNPKTKVSGTREMMSLSRYELAQAYVVKHGFPLDVAAIEPELMQVSLDGIERLVATKINEQAGFCQWCGASVPARAGEGQCNICAVPR